MLRHCLMLFMAVLGMGNAMAQSYVLSIHSHNGTKVQYSFVDNPILTFNADYLHVKTCNIEVDYPISLLDRYTINESMDSVDLNTIYINNDTIESFENTQRIPDCKLFYTRTFEDTEWQSWYMPVSIPYSVLEDDFEIATINNFHQYDDNNDGTYDRTELEIKHLNENKTLLPNYPYLIKAKTTGKKTIQLEGIELYETEANSINCSSVEYLYTFNGTYHTINDMRSKGFYYLEDGVLKKALTTSQKLKPFRWFLDITPRNSQYADDPIILQSKMIFIREINGEEEDDNTESNIEETTVAPAVVATYDVIGRKTQVSKAGVYIMTMSDGSIKKVFINK